MKGHQERLLKRERYANANADAKRANLTHCASSAGVGRTGVFITLSIVLERMRYEGVVDIFQTVKMLRTQRPAMVQTEVRGRTAGNNNTIIIVTPIAEIMAFCQACVL